MLKTNKGIFPLAGGDVRLPHCKPCGKNPACHPGAVVPSGTTVLYGLGPPSIPIPTTKTGDPETDAIITALAPKYCPAVKPASGISDSVGCGSVVAMGSPTVLVYNGGAAVAALSALAAAAGACGWSCWHWYWYYLWWREHYWRRRWQRNWFSW